MRDFFFHSEELLDQNALAFLEKESIPGILPCRWVHWNSAIQLIYFNSELTPLSEALDTLSLEDLRGIGKEIVDYVKAVEEQMELSAENIVWDTDSIYIDDDCQVFLICLPAVIPVEALESRIYVKRLYSILSEIFSHNENGDIVCRQIEAQRKKDIENWDELKSAIDRQNPEGSTILVLRSINLPEPIDFRIGRKEFTVGSDPTCDGQLDLPGIDRAHALIGWNGINFFIEDLGSESGTFLNDVQLQEHISVPFGSGSILRFAEYTFNVE